MFHPRIDGERGQALLMITLSLTFLMGVLGLVVDVGRMHYLRQSAQTAADAAAMAAVDAAGAAAVFTCASSGCASSLTNCSSVASGTSLYSACQYAGTNGFSSGGQSGAQTVQVQAGVNSAPPGYSSITAQYWVTVKISQRVPQLFSAVLGKPMGMVAAESSAMVGPNTSTGCIYVLDPGADSGSSSNGGMFVTGGGTLTAPCGIRVADTRSFAVHLQGDSHVVGGPITVAGGYQIDDSGQSTISGSPLQTSQGASCCANPFASLTVPSAITNRQNCTQTGQYVANASSNNNATLSPGVYCGGIDIDGANVTFSAGTYILNGGGLTIENSSTVTGTGVTFVNTAYTTTNNSYTGTYAGFLLSDSIVSVNLSAPTSGPLDGMLFYQDPSMPVGSAGSRIQGTANTTLQGTIYLPTTSLTYTGEAVTSAVMAMVVFDLELNGSSSLTISSDPTGMKTGLGAPVVTIVASVATDIGSAYRPRFSETICCEEESCVFFRAYRPRRVSFRANRGRSSGLIVA